MPHDSHVGNVITNAVISCINRSKIFPCCAFLHSFIDFGGHLNPLRRIMIFIQNPKMLFMHQVLFRIAPEGNDSSYENDLCCNCDLISEMMLEVSSFYHISAQII